MIDQESKLRIIGIPSDVVQNMLGKAKHTEYSQRNIAFIKGTMKVYGKSQANM